MPNDDSRNLETPDRPDERTRDDHRTDGLTPHARLEAIDRLAVSLLESARKSPDDRLEFKRHCREIRAEVECARRALSEDDGMVRSRGVGTTTWLGPEPGVVASRDE